MVQRICALLLLVACGSATPPNEQRPVAPTAPAHTPDAAVAAQDEPAADPPPPKNPDVPCAVAVGDGAAYPPPVGDAAPEREWTLRVRQHVLLDECSHHWDAAMRACIGSANDTVGVTACLDGRDPTERDELLARLTSTSEVAAKMFALRQKPALTGCKQVVAAHYGDAKWKGKLAPFKPAERKKMIVASRTSMTKACNADAWSETFRACIVAGGEQTCFEVEQLGLAWGYPAAGTVTSLGIPECDEYGAAIQALASCSQIDEGARAALSKSFHKLRAHMAGLSAEERKRVAVSCRAGNDAVRRIAQDAGC